MIFKEDWFEYFKEFYSNKFPFIHYTVNSWVGNDGFEINVCFNLSEAGNKGAKFDIREKFTYILDKIIKEANISFHYNSSNKNNKVKEVLIEDDDYTDDDLNNVAETMAELIADTFDSIQKAIDEFREGHKEEILLWKKELYNI